ncbi:MAG: hypothetical protein A3A80_01000 [Candidatus Terrybacteria bacterium RIFCSPLOWO2_01_FULL_44_24]|uniref:Uncharacterized protein n=1 Tax=Candidatus Terrybacteria bacterium RIFCSPHIGHO2_01_FULL_43_35 TaxID=1802361 RepID=A0A1G2PHR4_9BACT|nr:MAG: hypothetical protein A2828_04125 [Candidatus Terrybacteria bacterium RIFCSPHIGHO2_01_FULL_43_35]OHA49883.1 MAG: hypothetical protein A3B75_03180 [Candidatus Terrybacteria bacterium RIFCSPHIGHO2_02_FULL_43_14]OHA50718.1 MAG: hypothetical protein A3A80_01000 [Candidatus Terrybacteria bacterium RIFCSPLOWO2_01_FULL_44_24]
MRFVDVVDLSATETASHLGPLMFAEGRPKPVFGVCPVCGALVEVMERRVKDLDGEPLGRSLIDRPAVPYIVKAHSWFADPKWSCEGSGAEPLPYIEN